MDRVTQRGGVALKLGDYSIGGKKVSNKLMSFEILYLALVLLRCGSRIKGPKVLALASLGVLLARVESVFPGFELSNHLNVRSPTYRILLACE